MIRFDKLANTPRAAVFRQHFIDIVLNELPPFIARKFHTPEDVWSVRRHADDLLASPPILILNG